MRRPARRAGIGKLVRNEQTKLFATYINGIATALMAAGVIAPLIGEFTSNNAPPFLQLLLIFVACVLLSGCLHYLARRVLAGLSE